MTPTKSWLAPWPGTLARAESSRGLPLALQVVLSVLFLATLARLALPVPDTPVPITLQDLGVLLVGMYLGPRRGALAVAAYLGAGALGAPVFSNGNGGLAWLMGPTGGYLLAYPAAAFVVGWATRARRGLAVAAAGILAAQALVFLGGVLQLGLLTGRGAGELVALAVAPFLPGVAVKSALLVALAAAARARRETRPTDRP